ncbi:MAG: thioredoxin 1, partial [Pirellulaceae bacterium]
FFRFKLLTLLVVTAVVGAAVGLYIRMPAGQVEEVTDADFAEKVLASTAPVVVQFCADWCAPCKKAKPIIDEVAYEQRWQTKVYRADMDKSPKMAARFGITAIPALAVFEDGELKAITLGLREKSTYFELLAEADQKGQ